MKIEEIHRQEIKGLFESLKTKEDLLTLLNKVKVIMHGEKSHPFTLKQFNYHYSSRNNPKRYTEFKIKKKSGGERNITAPNTGLLEIQKCLNIIFQSVYNVHQFAFGFVPNKSILDNAKIHSGSLYVYNIDLKDFFPSIDQARIWGRLKHPPFNLNDASNRIELANIIAVLCCHKMEVERKDENGKFIKTLRSVLPQGAATSPILSNIICERLDIKLNGAAKRFGLKYSRYADDITFSSMHHVFKKEGDFIKEINKIILEQNFIIKDSKTRLQKQGYKQEVTGLIVNEKPNVSKRYIAEIRKWLYLWEQYGYKKATTFFIPQYLKTKSITNQNIPSLNNVLAGKLEFLKMIKGTENKMYIKLYNRFLDLEKSSNRSFNSKTIEGPDILEIIFNKDLNTAMRLYKPK